MKNLSIALNVVLTIAVAFLYYLHFKGSNNAVSVDESSTGTSSDISFSARPNQKVIYVNTDSLNSKYEFIQNELKQLEQEKNRLQGQIQGKAMALQQEMVDFQGRLQKGLFANEEEARKKEYELLQKEENLGLLREQLSNQLMDMEIKKNLAIQKEVHDFMKNYNKDKGFDYILGYQPGNVILYANDSLDATEEIINGLNNLYREKNAIKK